jgi:guanylate kinase
MRHTEMLSSLKALNPLRIGSPISENRHKKKAVAEFRPKGKLYSYFYHFGLNMSTIITVTGPSLSGKSYLEKLLVQAGIGDKVVSTTTRPMRAGETHGVDYYFCSKEEFLTQEKSGNLVEKVEFDTNFYGITKGEVDRRFDAQKAVGVDSPVVVVVVEPHGAHQVKEFAEKNGWACVRVFVSNPPDVIKARFDERFQQDAKASKEVYDQRWASMQTVEKAWRAQMADAELFFERFDAATQDQVVQTIREKVGAVAPFQSLTVIAAQSVQNKVESPMAAPKKVVRP